MLFQCEICYCAVWDSRLCCDSAIAAAGTAPAAAGYGAHGMSCDGWCRLYVLLRYILCMLCSGAGMLQCCATVRLADPAARC